MLCFCCCLQLTELEKTGGSVCTKQGVKCTCWVKQIVLVGGEFSFDLFFFKGLKTIRIRHALIF